MKCFHGWVFPTGFYQIGFSHYIFKLRGLCDPYDHTVEFYKYFFVKMLQVKFDRNLIDA